MDLSLINPYIRLATPSVLPAGHSIARRIIYDYELIYIECGAFTFMYNDVEYHCTKGDIIFICPGIPHSFHVENAEVSQPHIHFDITHRPHSDKIPISFKDIDNMTVSEKKQIHKNYFSSYQHSPLITIQNKVLFSEIFYRIISNKYNNIENKADIIQLIATVIKDNFPDALEEQTYSDLAHQIKDYIDAGNGFEMQLDDFENYFFQSKFHLEKIFKQAFSIGIIKYRNKKRMELAPCLLKNNSVSKVSEMLGYQSIYSFSRAYKQHYGHSPRKHIPC